MKYKIFIFSLFALITVGSLVMADYVDPTGGASSYNTPEVLKTGSDTEKMTVEKVGTSTSNTSSPKVGNFFITGAFSDKLTVMGATQIDKNFRVISEKFTIPTFDQYTDSFTYIDPVTLATHTSKPVEAVIPGRFTSKLIISNKESGSTPTHRLMLEPSSTFTPTTNIGLGNSCDLYPQNFGFIFNVNDPNGGCPAGSYFTTYKNLPTISGNPTAVNNNNYFKFGKCTYFAPSTTPSSTGRCYTEKSFITTYHTKQIRCDDLSSPDYGQVTSSPGAISWCNSPNRSYTGLCYMTISPVRESTRNIKVSTNGGAYVDSFNGFSKIDTCTTSSFTPLWVYEIIDAYGQYTTWTPSPL
jgi:hypothetical protein